MIFELRLERGAPVHVEESEGEHQAEGKASAKVLGLVFCSTTRGDDDYNDDNDGGIGDRVDSEE